MSELTISAEIDRAEESDEGARAIALEWLGRFDAAASAQSVERVVGLMAADSWWRDVYALTWDLTSAHGRDEIADRLTEVFTKNSLSGITLDDAVPASFQNDTYVEAVYRFATDIGTGRGVVRLVREDGAWKGFLVSTQLDGLKDFAPTTVTMADTHRDEFNLAAAPGTRRTAAEIKEDARAFRESDPSVLIIGAGHSGIFLAAYLNRLGVPTLLVDTYSRVGDNWRLRYNGLALHDLKWAVQFPYMPFPDHWPVFVDKDALADWHEHYVDIMNLNVWTDTRVGSAVYDAETGRWTVELDRNGEARTLRPNHIAIATGLNGLPKTPNLPGMSSFKGLVTHSSSFEGGSVSSGKRVVVVGAGSSGHDIAQDAYENGAASITMVQRSPTYVYSQRHGVPAYFGTYYSDQHIAIEDADLLAMATPTALGRKFGPVITRKVAEVDAELLAGLDRVGFKTYLGPDDAGLVAIASEGGASYYVDKGASGLIIDGSIRIQPGEVAEFTQNGVVYADGSTEEADIVVLCTGYENVRESIRPIVGDEVADTLATLGGLDAQGEVRTAMRHSGHEKLWFIANGLRVARILNKPVALMIKAIDEGLIDPAISVQKKSPEPGA